MSRESEMEALRERIEALERRLEAAFGPDEESHPVELWKEIGLLRVKTEVQMEKVGEILQSQAAELSALRRVVGGASGSGLN